MNFLNEGIDIDRKTRTVSFNDNHEDDVDTSLEHNPIVQTNLIKGVEVWSLFQRKTSSSGDGNPLVYAYKNENRWKFKSNKDKLYLEYRIQEIVDKFIASHPGCVVIVMPSTNSLNDYIAKLIQQRASSYVFIRDVITKLTTGEVEHMALDDPKSKFIETFRGNNYAKAEKMLLRYLAEMDEIKNGSFVRYMVLDKTIRDTLDYTFKMSKSRYAEYSNLINYNNVILLDDTISRGQSISDACKMIKMSYRPKSITVLTLISKLS